MEIEKYSPKWLLEKINNYKNDAHKLMHIIEYSKEIIKSTDQQLILSGVVNQRELLLDKMDKYLMLNTNLDAKDLLDFKERFKQQFTTYCYMISATNINEL